MLKNRFKIIVFIMLIIIALTMPVVRADDNEAPGVSSDEPVVTSESEVSQPIINENNYKDGDVYLTGDEITINDVVDGNVFVLANTVNINSQIGGDAFIIANNVNVNENSYILGNLFTIAKCVNVNGIIYDLYALASSNVNINGFVSRDIRIATDSLSISGTVRRNVYVETNNISITAEEKDDSGNIITSQGMIGGNLNYISKQEFTFPEGSVTGEVNFTPVSNSSNSIQTYILSLGKFLATVVLIWLLSLWLAPKFTDKTSYILSKKLPSSILLGIFVPMVIVLVSAILLLLGITSTIAMFILISLFAICLVSSSIFVIAFNNLLCERLKVEKTIGKLGILIISSLVLWLIALIPFVGGVVSVVTSLIGIGIVVNYLLPSKKINDEKQTAKKESTKKSKESKTNNNKK